MKFFFIFALFFSQAFSITPRNEEEKKFLEHVSIAYRIYQRYNENNAIFDEVYNTFKKDFKNFVDIPYLLDQVLEGIYKDLSRDQAREIENLYFLYCLSLIQQLKNPPVETVIKFKDYEVYKKREYAIAFEMQVPSSKKKFELVFIFDRKHGLKDAYSGNSRVIKEHRDDFLKIISERGFDRFLELFRQKVKKLMTRKKDK